MPPMERFVVLDSEKDVPRDNCKVDKMEKGCSGNAARKRLADISNLPQRSKPLAQDAKSQSNSANVKDYIEKLQKENAILTKLLADRNKIIELSGVDLQKLRVNLQKMQQQNLQLAQANSQMLAELNSGKDKQKMLHHELGCANGLLIAQKLVLECKGNPMRCQKVETKVEGTKFEENSVCSLGDRGAEKSYSTRRQQSKSLGPSIAQEKEKVEKKRLVARRQSSRFRQEDPKSNEHLDEIDHVKKIPEDSSADVQMQENILNPVPLTVKSEDSEGDSNFEDKTGGTRRLVVKTQSASFRQEEPVSAEHLDEIEHAKKIPEDSSIDVQMQENILNPVSLTVKNEDKKDDSVLEGETGGGTRRSSIVRPSRQATKKVQSYKEPQLNTKMRRTE